RPAKGRAKLILLQGLNTLSEVVGCIHRVVAQELPRRAMKGIGSSAGYDVGRRAGVASEFRVGVVSENPELGDGINWRFKHITGVHSVDIVSTVDHEIVGLGPLAVDGISLACTCGTSGLEQSG